ncbi:glycosyltransferase family 1 protein [Suillus clintonianus]|uniref:glycosyltransferase family 1 protein n=1 Tax=Suillus clintonianus TaxID=1904413 RepID=UPI001B880AD5|nr:glycosyltransferase family 1 protein [Suillus clintonianus]KAG2150586.1 glycosyltransferase family 1 protein [Suillus clintonianus]
MSGCTTVLLLILLLFCVRLFSVIFSSRCLRLPPANPTARQTCSIAIFLGSGGHTSEALKMASALDFSRYSPRIYIISEGDAFSAQKALALEHIKATTDHSFSDDQPQYKLLTIPRARRVHQSLLSTPPDAVKSLLACMYLVSVRPLFTKGTFRQPLADLLILNGPGTCVILCAAVLLNRLIGLPSPRVMYVESFARVKSLSLSGKLLYHFADRFVVQWPDLVQPGGREDYRGCLV